VSSLSKEAVLTLHGRLLARHGGLPGVRDLPALASALAQGDASFGGVEIYPTVQDKAAAIAHALIANHPFVDGNKRVGHAALEILLRLNGFELVANLAEREAFILGVASGEITRDEVREWVRMRVTLRSNP
jgi:death on curing protein